MDYLTTSALVFGVLYSAALLIKVCLDIYNNWPRKPPSQPS